MVAFVVVELRAATHPMFDLALFRKPAFAGASIAAFALSASMFAMFLYLTLYMQNVLGYSPLEAGLRFLPLTRALVLRRRRSRAALASASPVRVLLGVRAGARRLRLLLMRGLERRARRLDRAARRASSSPASGSA